MVDVTDILSPIFMGVIGIIGVIIVIYNPIWFSIENSIGIALTVIGFGMLVSVIWARRS